MVSYSRRKEIDNTAGGPEKRRVFNEAHVQLCGKSVPTAADLRPLRDGSQRDSSPERRHARPHLSDEFPAMTENTEASIETTKLPPFSARPSETAINRFPHKEVIIYEAV